MGACKSLFRPTEHLAVSVWVVGALRAPAGGAGAVGPLLMLVDNPHPALLASDIPMTTSSVMKVRAGPGS